MSAVRVILITVAGPAGHVDVGVRSDATPADLADALGSVIGVSPAATVIEHRSPPRPGVPEGGRALVRSGTAMAEAGVADGDLVLFRPADGGGGFSWPEVLQRPAEFGASSPAPDGPALSSLTARALPAPAPAPAEPGPTDHWPSAEPDPNEAQSATEASPLDPQSSAEYGAPDAEWPAEITEPDIGQPVPGERFLTAPRSGQPTAGRHARNRAAVGEPQPEPGQEITQEWPAAAPTPTDATDATEQSEQGQPWWHGGQEVNRDDWRG